MPDRDLSPTWTAGGFIKLQPGYQLAYAVSSNYNSIQGQHEKISCRKVSNLQFLPPRSCQNGGDKPKDRGYLAGDLWRFELKSLHVAFHAESPILVSTTVSPRLQAASERRVRQKLMPKSVIPGGCIGGCKLKASY